MSEERGLAYGQRPTMALYSFENAEEGFTVKVFEHKSGYSVTLIDECGETLGTRIFDSRVFPKAESKAVAYAESLAR